MAVGSAGAAHAVGPDEGKWSPHGGAPAISTMHVIVPMIFPVVGRTSYSDTFLACRSGCSRKHLGQDLMGDKMSPLVAVFTGTVASIKLETTVGDGNYISIRGDNGWSANYLHVNNDTPGTDDGRGTAKYAIVPGLHRGSRVFAGQLIGWRGDSGNAESTGPHLHFELRHGESWSGTVFNAFDSLNGATRITVAGVAGPHLTGTYVRATIGGEVWLIDNGKRRLARPSVLAANGVDARRIVRVTQGEIDSYPRMFAAPLRDGLVVRTPDKAVSLITGGRRVLLPTAADLAKVGVPITAVRDVPADALATVRAAADQTVPGVLHDGQLVRIGTSKALYYLSGGERHRVRDAWVMYAWGWRGGAGVSVPASTFAPPADPATDPAPDPSASPSPTPSPPVAAVYPLGAPLLLPDGWMVTDDTTAIWYVSGGQRHWLPNYEVRDAYGFKNFPVFKVPTSTSNALPRGPALPD